MSGLTSNKYIKNSVNLDITFHFLGGSPGSKLYLLLQNRRMMMEFISPDTAVCSVNVSESLPFDMILINNENKIVDQSLSYTVFLEHGNLDANSHNYY